ncbi:unnamed protein product [Owenia fusiformis]|uniref:C2H2-type domain-containing protein n=1 Tax=Owenia fusiformis TaxID=6347 RepID=A0A8S4N4F4_OWEFU|nr:unnamed protein product [Owenia fusiformis]
MAVFLMNVCKFRDCGLNFSTLTDLIQHIEDAHIDTDPCTLEKQELQQPPALALSYVLRAYSDATRREIEAQKKKVVICQVQSLTSFTELNRSQTPTSPTDLLSGTDTYQGSDIAEDSDDSYTTRDDFTSDSILSGAMNREGSSDKPYICPVPSCKKRYKNVNGIKYHAKHGHKTDGRIKKSYKCRCDKSYCTAFALRQHMMAAHPPAELTTVSHPTPPKKQVLVSDIPKISNITRLAIAVPNSMFSTLPIGDIPSVELPGTSIVQMECKDNTEQRFAQ